ncbi:MAG: membrane protein insertion efficiency factor YidD [Deltaproteobacteria bacterium]
MIPLGAGLALALAAGPLAASPSLEGTGRLVPLSEPKDAVAYLLGTSAEATSIDASALGESGDWDGSLPSAVVRSLFWWYHTFLSSQDVAACGFEPSCSRFSALAIDEHGFIEGTLATIDRLIRDSPLALPYYPLDLSTGLLQDDPRDYCLWCHR